MDPVWVVVLLVIYIVPTLIALARRTQMVALICALNVFLGWTIAGWAVSLALSILMPGDRTGRSTPLEPQAATSEAAAVGPARLAVAPAGPPQQLEFLLSPIRVVGLSVLAPVVYQYWWFWRFFQFAKQEGFPRARSFWWIFVPFYGWAVIGRILYDLEARLGPGRATNFNAQVAIALVVAGDVSAGWAARLPLSLALISAGLSVVFTAVAIYQIQTAANAYLRATYPGSHGAGVIPAELIAAAAGFLLAGILVLEAGPNVSEMTAYTSGGTIPGRPTPSPQFQPTPFPTQSWSAPESVSGTGTLTLASENGDYIGQGRSTTMSESSWWFEAAQSDGPGTISILLSSKTTATRWTVELAAPKGQLLRDGTYTYAQRAPFRTGAAPGLDVGGDGRGCNSVYGSFTVLHYEVDGRQRVAVFDASFEQHCESPTAPALRGTIRFQATAPS
jgi:Superinfection immunity protein